MRLTLANNAAELNALMANTNPADVGFLLDAGHAFEASADVPDYFQQHHRRIAALHLRDYKNGDQVPLGEGSFPLKRLATR